MCASVHRSKQIENGQKLREAVPKKIREAIKKKGKGSKKKEGVKEREGIKKKKKKKNINEHLAADFVGS